MEGNELLLRAVVGIFAAAAIVWIFLNARMRDALKEARTAAEGKLDETLALLKRREGELEGVRASYEKLLAERDTLRRDLDQERNRRVGFEERLNEMNVLRQQVKSLEDRNAEIVRLHERIAAREQQIDELRGQLAARQQEMEQVQRDIKAEVSQRAIAEEKLARLTTLEQRISDLDSQKDRLVKENAELKKTSARLDKLEEIKGLYERTLEENHLLKQQNLARNFIEIKQGLDRTIQAYNKTFAMFDKRALFAAEKMLDMAAGSTGAAGPSGEPRALDDHSAESSTEPPVPQISMRRGKPGAAPVVTRIVARAPLRKRTAAAAVSSTSMF